MKCKNCNNSTETRKHTKIKDKWLNSKQNYAFTQWEYCPNCSSVWHDEDYKVPVDYIIESLKASSSEAQQSFL